MSIHQNSELAWNEIVSSGKLTANREKVGGFIANNPLMTASEIATELHHGVRGVATAIFFLHKSGIIVSPGSRKDRITGYVADTWALNHWLTADSIKTFKMEKKTDQERLMAALKKIGIEPTVSLTGSTCVVTIGAVRFNGLGKLIK